MKIPNKSKEETETSSISIIPRKGPFPRRLRKVRRTYEVDSRKTIEKAIKNLQELAEEAHKRATAKYLPTEVRQKWARIEAYIYQTINSLTKTYDSQVIIEKLEELTKRVKELMEKDRESREEDQ